MRHVTYTVVIVHDRSPRCWRIFVKICYNCTILSCWGYCHYDVNIARDSWVGDGSGWHGVTSHVVFDVDAGQLNVAIIINIILFYKVGLWNKYCLKLIPYRPTTITLVSVANICRYLPIAIDWKTCFLSFHPCLLVVSLLIYAGRPVTRLIRNARLPSSECTYILLLLYGIGVLPYGKT